MICYLLGSVSKLTFSKPTTSDTISYSDFPISSPAADLDSSSWHAGWRSKVSGYGTASLIYHLALLNKNHLNEHPWSFTPRVITSSFSSVTLVYTLFQSIIFSTGQYSLSLLQAAWSRKKSKKVESVRNWTQDYFVNNLRVWI